MNIKYFQETDTLMINFSDTEIVETKDINEYVLIEVDKLGNLVSMTIEQAQQQANLRYFSYQQVA